VFHYVIGRGGFGKVSPFFMHPANCPPGLESRKEKPKKPFCYERNVQSKVHFALLLSKSLKITIELFQRKALALL